MLQHLLGMEVGDQKRYIIALHLSVFYPPAPTRALAYLDRFPPQNEKGLGSLRQEAREFMHQYVFDLVGLFYPDAYAHTVDAGFNEHLLIFIPRHREGVQEHLWGARGFDLGNIVSLGSLRGEIGEGEGGRERLPHAL
jgi:hypothetical protein